MTARRKRNAVPHPGSACCDLTQDLAGWLARERAALAYAYRWVRVLHARGRRLRDVATRAWTLSDRETGARLDAEVTMAHGRANAIAQSAMIREGHAARVEAAHAWRLSGAGK